MSCGSCGGILQPHFNFCPNCGAKNYLKMQDWSIETCNHDWQYPIPGTSTLMWRTCRKCRVTEGYDLIWYGTFPQTTGDF